jgi:hypothetical protein
MYVGASSVIGAYIGGSIGITLPITVPAYVVSEMLHMKNLEEIREQNRQKKEEIEKRVIEKHGFLKD